MLSCKNVELIVLSFKDDLYYLLFQVIDSIFYGLYLKYIYMC